jgi:hypothetical protein
MTTATARRLTVLELITDRSSVATRAANKHRDECEDWKEAGRVCMKSYRQGEAIAYKDAHDVMKRELERLRNLWQNGSITYSDFTGI